MSTTIFEAEGLSFTAYSNGPSGRALQITFPGMDYDTLDSDNAIKLAHAILQYFDDRPREIKEIIAAQVTSQLHLLSTRQLVDELKQRQGVMSAEFGVEESMIAHRVVPNNEGNINLTAFDQQKGLGTMLFVEWWRL